MASNDPPPTMHDDDDAYVSADDEDFAPEDQMSVDSDSDADGATTTRKPAQASAGTASGAPAPTHADDVGEIERDEVEGLMQDAGKRKKKGGRKGDDSEGEGGLVQTRSMAAAAQQERAKKPLASGAGATIDVDAVWRRLNERHTSPPPPPPPPQSTDDTASPSKHTAPNAMVEITETYRFAGTLHTRKRLVPQGSAEASAAAAEDAPAPADADRALTPTGKVQLRPLRRVSAFDPNPNGAVRNLPAKPGEPGAGPRDPAAVAAAKSKNKGAPRHAYAIPAVRSVKRLNVVDKSKLDWHAHVDATGAREELDAAQKDKTNFLERRDFLERVEGREDAKRLEAKAR